MNALVNLETRSVSSLFRYLEMLCCQKAPKSGRALLGSRWSFANLNPVQRKELTEYSLPGGGMLYSQVLANRTGVCLQKHQENPDSLERFLARGGAAIVPVNSYYLPYRPAYGRVHSHRTLLVTPSPQQDQVWVQDLWPPGYMGPLAKAVLSEARLGEVPLDRHREPVFAGGTLDGSWFSLRLDPVQVKDPRLWAMLILKDILDEATNLGGYESEACGLNSFTHFIKGLEQHFQSRGDERWLRLREDCLLLRAELSSRVYFVSFLRAAAGWLQESDLKTCARNYSRHLNYWEMARDVLIKTMVHPNPNYDHFILQNLALAWDREQDLLRNLLALTSPTKKTHTAHYA